MRTARAKKETSAEHKPGSTFFGKSSQGSSWSGGDQPFFGRQTVQTKLTIGQPNDKYEQEADAMADKVVQRLSKPATIQTKPLAPAISPFIQPKCARCEEEEKLQRKEEDDDLQNPKVQRKCAECEKAEKLQAKANFNSLTASPATENRLAASKGSGHPLPSDTRQQMETSFGTDFSGLQIHNDSAAVQMNKDLNAQAFTHGRDIYFNSGKYDPNSAKGQHLLAHELTHVVQQSGRSRINNSLQRQESPPEKESENQNLQEVYFARKDRFLIAIPGTYTTLEQLARFLFKAANIKNEDIDEGTSPLDLIVKSMKELNGLVTDDIYGNQHVFLGDLPAHYGLTDKAAYLYKKGPQFSENVIDVQAELTRMGVGSLEGFIVKKNQLDFQIQFDILAIIAGINAVAEGTIYTQRKNEEYVVNIIRRWVREPLTTQPANYPNGGEYFDKIILALHSNVFLLDNILPIDEWTSSYNLMFNRFVFYKNELAALQKAYSYTFKNDMAQREMSLWQDFAKPALIRIPAAITEETSCFIKSLPSDLAKDIGEGLHGISENYLDTVLPEEKEANQQTLDIACTFGEIVFDLAGALGKVKKVIDAIQSAEELYKTYKEVTVLIENLPEALSIFDDSDKFFDTLFALSNNTALDRVEKFVNTEQQTSKEPQPQDKKATKTGLTKFRQAITDFVALIKKILKPIFQIRRKFMEFMAKAEDTLVGNPVYMKLIQALIAGKKISEFPGNLSEKIVLAVGNLLGGLKDQAGEFIQGIGDKARSTLDGFKNQISLAIADFAIAEIKKIGGTVKAALSIPNVRARVDKLISSQLINPLLDKVGFDKIATKVSGIVDMLVKEAMDGVNFVVDGLSEAIRSTLNNFDLQLHSKTNADVSKALPVQSVSSLMEHSTGQSLNGEIKDQMELGFGQDFSSVKIHQDAPAANASEQLSADAFTKGDHIYFNDGQFDPNSKTGRQLLAHELTHVVQQQNGPSSESIRRSLKNKPKNIVKKVLNNSLKVQNKLNQAPPKKLVKPGNDPAANYETILRGELMDLNGFVNPQGTKLKIDPNLKDHKGRTNKERMKKGLTPLLDEKTKVELHHRGQTFFGFLDEISTSYHRQVDDDPDYHPYADDPGYLSWRGEVAWYNGKIMRLGSIYDNLRRKYWRQRAKEI